jgi:hypothetical protein
MIELILFLALAQDPADTVKKWPEWQCVRWAWSGDVYSRVVWCLEWRPRDHTPPNKKS